MQPLFLIWCNDHLTFDAKIPHFILLLSVQFLEQYGEVSMLDIKGADASRVVLVIGIMTLHSFGEGSGVGVSFAGSKGLTQGLLVTLAIAVHNIPEGLAVSMVLASRGVSPQNAMLWGVIFSPTLLSRCSLPCNFYCCFIILNTDPFLVGWMQTRLQPCQDYIVVRNIST